MLLKSSEAAERLNISKTTLHRYVKAGRLSCVRFAANSVYFTEQQLSEFIEQYRKRYQPRRIQD
ncbi:helix-turn-helix domain-containing protein [bacterium]|nr:helix-turn-helix domain-containing protein [bacterium]MBU1638064.1 helix-turn-helix domain-containing protein [bacterium]MBU1920636.1 helix-turn-helix domain-containing protein [bacterium]